MLTVSELMDRLIAMVADGLPAPSDVSFRIAECPGTEPNWTAETTLPLPMAMAERWAGALTRLQWNTPVVDFSAADEGEDGVRAITRVPAGARGGHVPRGRSAGAASRTGRDRKGPRSRIAWIAGVPAALAILAALIAMAE
ncbi:MAG: hypothetical protein KDK07_08480 [Bauldia sp.]|nr:hypothetical protein [Bauldia sp.]